MNVAQNDKANVKPFRTAVVVNTAPILLDKGASANLGTDLTLQDSSLGLAKEVLVFTSRGSAEPKQAQTAQKDRLEARLIPGSLAEAASKLDYLRKFVPVAAPEATESSVGTTGKVGIPDLNQPWSPSLEPNAKRVLSTDTLPLPRISQAGIVSSPHFNEVLPLRAEKPAYLAHLERASLHAKQPTQRHLGPYSRPLRHLEVSEAVLAERKYERLKKRLTSERQYLEGLEGTRREAQLVHINQIRQEVAVAREDAMKWAGFAEKEQVRSRRTHLRRKQQRDAERSTASLQLGSSEPPLSLPTGTSSTSAQPTASQ